MNSGRLILHPKRHDRAGLENEPLVELLRRLGLVAGVLEPQLADYLAGDRFPGLVTFLGCSPYILLEPPADGGENFCHVRLLGPYPEPRFLFAANTRPPRCTDCGTPIREWRDTLVGATIHCPHCGAVLPVAGLGWRRHAGLARRFIEIHNVFPGEAVPGDELMALLQDQAGAGEWGYFYLQ